MCHQVPIYSHTHVVSGVILAWPLISSECQVGLSFQSNLYMYVYSSLHHLNNLKSGAIKALVKARKVVLLIML